MKRLLLLLTGVLLIVGTSVSIFAADPAQPTIADKSTAVATLDDGTQLTLHFSALGNGSYTVRAALARDQLVEWTFTPGTGPLPPPVDTPIISTATLPDGLVGSSYLHKLAASGGLLPYNYSLQGGSLPGGIVLVPDGTIVGTSATEGVFSPVFKVTDAKGLFSTKSLNLTITSVVPPVPPPPPPVPSKLRVLILYDAKALGSMTESQREMLVSTQPGSLRAFCKTACLTDAEGNPEMRVWSLDAGKSNTEARFKPLVDKSSGQQGIVIQSGEDGLVTLLPFPADSTAAIVSLQKYVDARGPPKAVDYPNGIVISDENYKEFLRPGGYGFIKGTVPKGTPKFSDSYSLIPRSQWKALIAEGKGTFLSDLKKAAGIKQKNQNGLNYCWAYASVATVETIRALQGQPHIDLSPESVGGPVKNWRNVGGWGYDALDQLTKYGACSSSYMNSPNSLSPSRWKSGWEADALNHKIIASWASIDDGSFDAVVTAALLRLPVSIGLDWWGHQVEVCDPVILDNGQVGVLIMNSWANVNWGDGGYGTLTESKSQPSGSFACISVGTSDRSMSADAKETYTTLVKRRSDTVKKLIQTYSTAP